MYIIYKISRIMYLLYTGCSRKIVNEIYCYPMDDYTENIKIYYHVYVITYGNKYIYLYIDQIKDITRITI